MNTTYGINKLWSLIKDFLYFLDRVALVSSPSIAIKDELLIWEQSHKILSMSSFIFSRQRNPCSNNTECKMLSMISFNFQTEEPLSILHELQSKMSYSSRNNELRHHINDFLWSVRDCPRISVLGFMDLTKESALTVSKHIDSQNLII